MFYSFTYYNILGLFHCDYTLFCYCVIHYILSFQVKIMSSKNIFFEKNGYFYYDIYSMKTNVIFSSNFPEILLSFLRRREIF